MIEHLESVKFEDISFINSYILDTCFVLYELEKGNQKKLEEFCRKNNVYMTSFNLEELEKVEKRIHNIKHFVKDFLDKNLVKKIEIPIHIGEFNKEKKYAQDIDSDIIKLIQDPSDAVMVATAILTKSNILTRDKHHVFTSDVENELKKYSIEVLNNF